MGHAKNKDANRLWIAPLTVFATTVASVAEATHCVVPWAGRLPDGTKGQAKPAFPGACPIPTGCVLIESNSIPCATARAGWQAASMDQPSRTEIIMATLASCPACRSGDVRPRPKLGDWTCLDCGHCWNEDAKGMVRDAGVIERQGRELPALDQLPYPVALTMRRLADAEHSGGDPLKAMFRAEGLFRGNDQVPGHRAVDGLFL